jgi:hypothetical protein
LVVHKSGAREIGVRPLPSDNRAEPCRTRVGSGRSGGRLRGRVRVHRISVACGSALGITRRARSRRDCPKQKARQRAFHRRRPVRRDLSVENRHWIEGLFSFWQGTSLKWHGPKAYGGSGTVCSKPSEPRPRGRAGTQGTSPDQNSDHTSIAKPVRSRWIAFAIVAAGGRGSGVATVRRPAVAGRVVDASAGSLPGARPLSRRWRCLDPVTGDQLGSSADSCR